LLHDLDRYGRLGARILDAGSGSLVMVESIQRGRIEEKAVEAGSFYPTEGKKVVRVDLGAPYLFRRQGPILELQADITDLDLDRASQLRRLAILASHLGFDARSERPLFDTILLSDVLNYVDHRATISALHRFLAPGGRLVVHNTPGKGWPGLFARDDVLLKDNRDLISHIRSLGMRIEHLTSVSLLHTHTIAPPYPALQSARPTERLTLVARSD